jgi:hypothetical protein
MYKRNNTKAFARKNLQSGADQAYVRASARRIDGESREQKRRIEKATTDEQTVTEHREKKTKSDKKKAIEHKKINNCPAIFDVERFRDQESLKGINVAHIDLQIKWHRSHEILVDTKSEIPAVSKLKKQEKVEVLIAALERWNTRVEAGEFPQNGPAYPDAEVESEEVESDPEEEESGTDINFQFTHTNSFPALL